jgi:dTDP-4-dehydrorhamnose 3,5-epimerase
MAKVVLYDSREDSPTHGQIEEFFIGDLNPLLIKIPPFVMHGFRGLGPGMTLMVNVPTELYNYEEPDEYRLPSDTDQIPYDWARKDR